MQWRRSLHYGLNGKNGCQHISRETPDPESSPSGCSDVGRCQPDWTEKTAVTTLRERRLIPRVHILDAVTKVVALRTEQGKRQSHRLKRDAWSLKVTFWMQWRRSFHSGLNGKNGSHKPSRETPDPESSPSGCSDVGRCQPDWTEKTAVTTLRERRLIPRVHILDAVTKVVALRTEQGKRQSHRLKRDAWSLKVTFWMQWRRSFHSGLNGKNGSHKPSRETPDPESSPSGCSDEGRCNPDWTGKTAVTTLRERFLIPRVHLLDAMTKVVALWTKREKWLSTYFERNAWSREFTFWMQWRRSLHYGLNGKNGCQHISRETPDPESSPFGCNDEGRCTMD